MFALKSTLGAIALMLSAIILPILATPVAATELVMVEQTGCEWCERWDEEIAPAYPKTTEGKFAPLRRVDLYAIPKDMKLTRRVNFTPTFLIVEQGQELARIEGYPGADFFWPVLAQLLREHTKYDPNTGENG
jgi:thioredoxin-related protein